VEETRDDNGKQKKKKRSSLSIKQQLQKLDDGLIMLCDML
jgi:hypothetical protein